MYNKWLLSICFLIISISFSYGRDLPNQVAGNANDTNLATFMFSSNNQLLQLTKKDGSPISYNEVNKLYGTPEGMTIFVDGIDVTSTEYRYNMGYAGIRPIGLDLSKDNWQDIKIPADEIAIDPNTGRFKFSSGNTALPKLGTTCDIAGVAYSLYVKDKYAYVIYDYRGLKIIDISTPTPRVVVTYQPGGFFYAVAGDDKYLYIARGNAGLRIIDISNPTELKVISNVGIPGWSYNVYVKGDYVYMSTHEGGVYIVDVKNKASPKVIGSYNTPGRTRDVYVDGKYAYLADDIAGVQILDISNPTAPVLVGSYDTPGNAYSVYIYKNYAFIADYLAGIQIINISNPATPTLVSTYNTDGEAFDVSVIGDYAYIADGTRGFVVLNISNIRSPQLFGKIALPNATARELYIIGDYAYLASSRVGMQIIDIPRSAQFPAPKSTVTVRFNSKKLVEAVLLIPTGNEVLEGGNIYPITWRVSNLEIPSTISLYYSVDSGLTYPYHIADFVQQSIGTFTYNWKCPLINSDKVKVKIAVKDKLGHIIAKDDSDNNFTINTTQLIPRTDAWQVRLSVKAGEYADVVNGGPVFGIHPDASEGLDSYDKVEPPEPIKGKYITLYYPHPEAIFDKFDADIRTPFIGTKTWQAIVKTNISNTHINISWQLLPQGYNFILYDINENKKIAMVSGGTYTYFSPAGGSKPLEFIVTSISESIKLPVGTVAGVVTNAITGEKIQGIKVVLSSIDQEIVMITDKTGYYISPPVKEGTYSIKIESDKYESVKQTVVIKANVANTINFNLIRNEFISGTSTAIPGTITREGKVSTTISSNFFNEAILPIDNFLVTFKLRHSDTQKEITLVHEKRHGESGVTITRIKNSYIVTYDFDPDITFKVGLYDIYCELKYGDKIIINKYEDNLRKLNIVGAGIEIVEEYLNTGILNSGSSSTLNFIIKNTGSSLLHNLRYEFSQIPSTQDGLYFIPITNISLTPLPKLFTIGSSAVQKLMINIPLYQPSGTYTGKVRIYEDIDNNKIYDGEELYDELSILIIVRLPYERVILVEPLLKKIYFNEEVNVDVRIEAITDLYGFQFNLKFNPALLQLVDVKEGDFLKSDNIETYWIPPQVIDNGKGICVVCIRLGDKGVNGGGILAKVKFKARQLPGTATLILEEVKLSNSQGEKIPIIKAIDSEIIISEKPQFRIYHNAIGPLKANDTLEVTILGDSNGTATFDIGNMRTSLAMKEVSLGVYKGSYTIQPGDNLLRGSITGYLTIRGISNSQSAPVLVTIDTIPPTTTLTIGTPTYHAYINSITPITLTALDTGSGIASIRYNINNTGWMTYTSSFKITTPGSCTIYYQSIDVVGNSEKIKVLHLFVDNIPPITTDNAPLTWQKSTVTVTLIATDTGCGVKNTYYTINGATPTLNSATGTVITFYKHGTYTLRYSSIDWVDNMEEPKTAIIRIDKEAPIINITQPVNKSIVTHPNILIEGSVIDTSIQIGTITLQVNELENIIPVNNNMFSSTITLTSGLNTIKLIATDLAGNIGSSSLLIALVTSKIDVLANQPATLTTSKGTKVNIPVNAFNRDITFTLNDTPKQSLYKQADDLLATATSAFDIPSQLVNEVYEITAFYRNDCSQILQPTLPLTITLTYNDSITGDIESNLNVCRLDTKTNQWILIDEEIKIDNQLNTITFSSTKLGIYRLISISYRIKVLDKNLHFGMIDLNQSPTSLIRSFRIKNISRGGKTLTNIKYIISDLQNINNSTQLIPATRVKIIPNILNLIPANQEKKIMVKIDLGKTVPEGIYSGNILIYTDLNNNNQFDKLFECSDSVNLSVVVSTKVIVNLSISPRKKTIDLNEESNIDIYFQAPHSIAKFSFILQFDPQIIEVLSVERGSVFSPGNLTLVTSINNQDGTVRISGKRLDNVKKGGSLAIVRFKPKAYGRSNLGFKDIEFIEPTYLEKVEVITINGNIVVNPWDVELDGIIDIYDLVKVGRYFNSKIGDRRYIPASDLNDDGEIDIYDLVMVVSHLGKRYNFTKVDKPSLTQKTGFVTSAPTVSSVPVGEIMITSENQKIAKDELLVVDINVDQVTNLLGFQFDIMYDDNVLEVVNIEYADSLLNTGTGTIYIPRLTKADNVMNIGASRAVPSSVSGSGRLVRIIFKPKTDNVDTTISISNIKLAGTNAEKIPVNVLIDKLKINIQAQLQTDFSATYIWPNPAKKEKVHFVNLPANTNIRIFNLAGEEVFNHKVSAGGEYIWEGKNIASGIYIYLLTDDKGNKKVGKLGIIK